MQGKKRARKPALHDCVITACTMEDLDELKEIENKVKLLGGIFSVDICDGLTHLICKEAGTNKHRRVCLDNSKKEKQNKVFIIKLGWLQQCFSASIKVNEGPYLVPPLYGFEICCTGLEAGEKSIIEKISQDAGAQYSRILGTNCTHLICESPIGKKYEFALKEPSIRIVRPKWIHECGRLHTLVDETPYLLHPDGDKDPTVSCGTEVLGSVPQTCGVVPGDENQHSLSNIGTTPNINGDDSTKKLSCSMDAAVLFLSTSPIQDNDQYAPLQRHAMQLAKKCGATISGELNVKVNYIIVIRAPIARRCIPLMKAAKEKGIPIASLKWLEACVHKGQLLSHENFSVPDWGDDAGDNSSHYDKASGDWQSTVTSTIFQGIRVVLGPLWLRDANQCNTVSQQLISGRAKVLSHDSSGYVISGVPTHIVCPADSHPQENELKESMKSMYSRATLVTAFWVDSCIAKGKLLPANVCILFQPLDIPTPLPDISKNSIVLTISGFQKQDERDWNRRREILSRLAVLLGAKYSERMRRRYTTHLIADERQAVSDKMEKARQWHICLISCEWLIECAKAGCLLPLEDYIVDINKKDVDTKESGKLLQTEDKTPTKRSRNIEKMTPRKSPRRSSRLHVELENDVKEKRSSLPPSAISLFKRFTEGLNEKAKANEDSLEIEKDVVNVDDDDMEGGGGSRSVSRDAVEMNDRKEWSMDASQSQVIMHRDLTPPPSPKIVSRGNVRNNKGTKGSSRRSKKFK